MGDIRQQKAKFFPTLFTCDNGSEKGTGVNENEHTCDPLL